MLSFHSSNLQTSVTISILVFFFFGYLSDWQLRELKPEKYANYLRQAVPLPGELIPLKWVSRTNSLLIGGSLLHNECLCQIACYNFNGVFLAANDFNKQTLSYIYIYSFSFYSCSVMRDNDWQPLSESVFAIVFGLSFIGLPIYGKR